jgi:hypothetical protein
MATKTEPKKWTPAHAAKLLDRADALGLSDCAFGKREGIDPQRISWWRKRLERPRPERLVASPASAPAFVEVRHVAPTATQVEVRLKNGRSVVFPSTIDPRVLTVLLDAVEASAC